MGSLCDTDFNKTPILYLPLFHFLSFFFNLSSLLTNTQTGLIKYHSMSVLLYLQIIHYFFP